MDGKSFGKASVLVLCFCAAVAGTAGAADTGGATGWAGWMMAAAVSAGLHGAWLHRGWMHGGWMTADPWNACGSACWAICAWLAARGAGRWGAAEELGVGLELAPLLAMGAVHGNGQNPVARWRRWQTAVASELALSEGLAPWARRCLDQAWRGRPASTPMAASGLAGAVFREAVSAAEPAICARVRDEEFRALVRAALDGVAVHAATEYAAAGMSCAKKAREAAVALRDASMALTIPLDERERLAEWCAATLLEITERRDAA